MDDMSNPWAAEEAETLALRNILRLANGKGYESPVTETSGMVVSPSLQLIERLRHKSDVKKEINSVSASIQRRLVDKETSDITHTDVIESKIGSVSSLNAHLQSVLERKQELTSRLQQPVMGDNLRVEAAYHEHVRKLFPQIALHLAHLNQNLENIDWSNNFTQTDEQLEEYLADITGKLAQIQTGLQDIAQLRATLQNI